MPNRSDDLYAPRHGSGSNSSGSNNTDARRSYEFLYGAMDSDDVDPSYWESGSGRNSEVTRIVPDEVISEYDNMTTTSYDSGDYNASRYGRRPKDSSRNTYKRAADAYSRSTAENREPVAEPVEYAVFSPKEKNTGSSRSARRKAASSNNASGSITGEGAVVFQADAQGKKSKSPRKRKRRRRIIIVVACIIVALLVAVAAVGITFFNSAKAVRAEASTITKAASQIMSDFSDGNIDAVVNDINQMADSATFMKEETSGPLWSIAENLPVYGTDVKNAKVLSNVFDDLCQNMLVPFSGELPNLSLGSIVRDDGSIDVNAITGLLESINQYKEVIARSHEAIADLTPGSVEQANKALDTAQEYLGKADSLIEQADAVLPLLPQMLGANGATRNYIIIAQNNSELRATGGFAGSWGLLSITDGRISLGDFESFGNMRDYVTDAYVDMQPGEELFFYPDFHEPGQYDLTPKFDRFASLCANYWLKGTGQAVDGVIAIDPIFLSHVLGVVGGVYGPDGTYIDEGNAVQVLEHDVYFTYTDNEDMDAYFASVASAAFNQVIHGIGKSTFSGLLEVIGRGGEGKTLQVWMVNGDEQALMSSFGLTGPLDGDATSPTLGIFINDHTGSKMDYYLDVNTTISEGVKNADGTTTYQVTTTATDLVNTDRGDPDWALPSYVTGAVGNGGMFTEFLLFAPYGGTITDINLNADLTTVASDVNDAQVYGYDAHRRRFWIGPGSTVTINYTVTTSAEATEPLDVEMTATTQKALQGEI